MTIIWFSYLRSRQFAAAVAKITTLSVTMIVTDMANLMVSNDCPSLFEMSLNRDYKVV